ncbi:MAG: hypothetical protein U9R27_09455 [Campylobacterota bacterium]|nr:hypothetical protein [Campylobacterota bacterium]
MQKYKTYLKRLFIVYAIIFASAYTYAYYFYKNYPIPVTNRISFDAKIKFIRENIDVDSVDTIIVGSSIGLNNIQGAYLEKGSKKCNSVLNLSVYEASAFQVEQLLELTDAFPNLKRIIYSAQFSDFPYPSKFKDYDPEFIKKYIRHELNPIEYFNLMFDSCKNLIFCIKRELEWGKKHAMNNKFTYLGFDHTGSVPLHIYGKDIIHKRWAAPHGSHQEKRAFPAVARMTKKAHEKGIKFYFVQQPYRQALIDQHKHIQNLMITFPERIKKIMAENGGLFFSLHEELHLDDKYFADRSHLNDQGSIIGSEAIGKFIDENEK